MSREFIEKVAQFVEQQREFGHRIIRMSECKQFLETGECNCSKAAAAIMMDMANAYKIALVSQPIQPPLEPPETFQ